MRISRVMLCGVERPAILNMAAFMYLGKTMGKSLPELFDITAPVEDDTYRFMYAALMFGAEATKEKFDMTYSEFSDLLLLEAADSEVEALGDVIKTNIEDIIIALNKKAKKKGLIPPDEDLSGDQP